MNEYRASARILATGAAANIIAEVAQDLFARWQPTGSLHALMHLGQYVGTARAQRALAAQQQDALMPRNIVDSAAHWVASSLTPSAALVSDAQAVQAMLRAAEDAQGVACVPALAFVGGMAVALDGKMPSRAADAFAGLAHRAATQAQSACITLSSALGVCVEVAAQLGIRRVAELLARRNGSVLNALADTVFGSPGAMDPRAADLLAEIIYARPTQFTDARRVVHVIHGKAISQLLDSDFVGPRTLAMLRVLESVLQRYYAGPRDPSLDDLWPTVTDALAVLYPSILHVFGRDSPPDAFRSACLLAVTYTDEGSHVEALFAGQPCLLSAPGDVGRVRAGVVLFYLDFFEHLAGKLSAHVLVRVVSLAARYAGSEVLEYPGPMWFESAHALILAVLESDAHRMGSEIAPWYSDLVLDMYPDRGISADLLRISYTAAVRAIPGHSAWDRVTILLRKADQYTADSGGVRAEIFAVRRRELLLVAAELLIGVPAELLPQLMFELRSRLVNGNEKWSTRVAVVDHCQDLVLTRADVARKPALSMWVWQLRVDIIGSKL
ncbi:hypothetical protein GGI17_006532 [Coemansia sp. S146]|nr:hypothetical protein GGI17_006532 [Coemansia sp. S146]